MKFLDHAKIALNALGTNKLRSFLTALGIIIGITGIVVVFSAGQGIKQLILGEIQAFGTDIIQTEIKVPSDQKGFESEQQSAMNLAMGVEITTLTLEDMKDLEKLPNITQGYGAVLNQNQISYGNEFQKSYLFGTNESYIDIDKSEVAEGRFFTEEENDSLQRVAVLGTKIKEDLFGETDPIGRSIRIGSAKYRIVGVMEERGSVSIIDFDEYVYLPIKTLQKRIMGIDHLTYMVHELKDSSEAEFTAAMARDILRRNHDITPPDNSDLTKTETAQDDFRVVTMGEMMEMMDVITLSLTALLIAIVSISLIVGGVGVMNIMYVVVTERKKEIGLRKAVGARYRDIIIQFLMESVVITLLGGMVGMILGTGASYLLFRLGSQIYGLNWSFVVPIEGYLTAIIFSVVFGVLFGMFPAGKAAKMDPITALKDE
jgi:putative ABC transport system permease protein